MQDLATTGFIRIGVPVLFGLASATIGALSRRWWETRILKAIPEADLVAYEWVGTFQQAGTDNAGNPWPATPLSMKLKATWKRVSGTIAYDSEKLGCSGGFYQSRVLTLHYWATQQGTLQSGVLQLYLPPRPTTLRGHFAGYGPETEGLVQGSLNLRKKVN